MNLTLYSIYDRKTEVFTVPVGFHNDEHAIRDIKVELSKAGMLAKFPEDYELVQVGQWNDSEGQLNGISPVRLVRRLDQLVDAKPQAGEPES